MLTFNCLTISDFDEDDMISDQDLKEVVDRLTGEQKLSKDEMQQLIDNVGITCKIRTKYLQKKYS